MRRRQAIRGLTMLELVLAMVILFFVGMAVLQFFDSSLRLELKNKDRTTAVKLAQRTMEDQIDAPIMSITTMPAFAPHPLDGHYCYRIITSHLSVDDPTYPSYTYNMREIKAVVKGPLSDDGQPIARTQIITMKVWRPLPPTSIEDFRALGSGESCGAIY
jgi:hypothetical protein